MKGVSGFMRQRTVVLFGLALVLAGAGVVYGEEEKKESIELPNIVVTATRTEKELESVPASVSLITQKEIKKRNIKTTDEAVNTETGVIATRGKGFMDTHSSVYLRGFTGQNRTLVLLDGMVFNDPYSGGVLWPAISPENLERIEVVKGASSSLYGGYAMGGVIQLFTRMPTKREFILQGGYGNSLGGGSEGMKNLYKTYVSYGDRIKDRFRVLVSNNYTTTDGYRAYPNVQSSRPGSGISGWSQTTDNRGNTRYLIGEKGDNGYWHDNLVVKTQYDISDASKVNFTFMRSENEYDYDDPETFLRDAAGAAVWSYGTVKEASFLSGPGGDEQYIYNLGVETELSPVKLKMSFSYFDQTKAWYVTPDSSVATRSGGKGKISNTPSEAYSFDMQGIVPLFNRHLVTAGGSFRTGRAHSKEHSLSDWRNESAKGDLVYESEGYDRTFALFLQDEIAILDNLTVYLGVRQDWWKTFDGYANQIGTAGFPIDYASRSNSSFSPKGAVVYKPFKETTLRGSLGRAFRAPTILELYRTVQDHGGTVTAGNPDLKPETAISWDLGIEQGLWSGARIKATYFENYIEDMIYSKSETPTLKTKVNAGKAESRGVELEAEQRILRDLLRLFANYTYIDSEIKENIASPASVGKRMTAVPEHMVNVGADFEYGRFGALVTGRYVGKRYGYDDNSDTAEDVYGSYDPCFKVDVKIRYELASWASLSFSVDNLFNEQYYSYYRAPGRWFFSEITLRF